MAMLGAVIMAGLLYPSAAFAQYTGGEPGTQSGLRDAGPDVQLAVEQPPPVAKLPGQLAAHLEGENHRRRRSAGARSTGLSWLST